MRSTPQWSHHAIMVAVSMLAVIVAGWNLYISSHDDGIIAGPVRDRAGCPVPGAEAIFFGRNFISYQEKQRMRTDAAGAYRFAGMQVHVGQLEAQLPDGRRSARRQLRLWFRAQNTEVPPLVIGMHGS